MLKILKLLLFVVTALGQEWSPHIQVLEIVTSEDNSTETIRQVPKGKNSEIIVGEDIGPKSRLIIKCNATFPVQIIYIGAGRPEFTTFTNVLWINDTHKPLSFEAEASLGLLGFQGSLRVEDTGNYTCRSIQNSTILSYYYLYVPGPSLFTPPDGYNSELYFTPKDKNIWIPCAAAHPRAMVTLHKTANGKLQCPAFGKNLATYDPRKGFLLNLKDNSNKKPEGVYVCIASQNQSFRMMEYKLIATNVNSTTGGGKNPCSPSPCGHKAECSVIDGHPVCYCFRGLSGNPYSECMQNEYDQCQSNAECPNGESCLQGKCTQNPCDSNPCGSGSSCVSFSGRPRCSCKSGYEGKPPYCLKKCQYNAECGTNEICTRNRCQDPCPNRCGIDAHCQVVQTGYNRTAICTCGPGTTGNPSEKCYDIGVDPNERPQKECPPGYIGPGPPNCRREECSDTFECPPNKYCSPQKLCILIDVESQRPGSTQCEAPCGDGAMCQLSRSRSGEKSSTCVCPPGMIGDPYRRCIPIPDQNNTSVDTDPCNPSPCPRNSICKVRYIRADEIQVNCICPPGMIGTPPNCHSTAGDDGPTPNPKPPQKQCYEDPDCPRGMECIGRLCYPIDNPDPPSPQCYAQCGRNARCVRLNRCECIEGAVGDPYEGCAYREQNLCDPSPCASFAVCRVINERAKCRCILGYEGDGVTSCRQSNDNSVVINSLPDARRRSGYIDDQEYRPSNSRFATAVPVSIERRGFDVGSRRRNFYDEIPRKDSSERRYRDRDECNYRRDGDGDGNDGCRRGFICRIGRDGVSKCVCNSEDCSNPSAGDPCSSNQSPCRNVANSECRVIEGIALCSCRRGFVGNPSSGLDCRKEQDGSQIEEPLGAIPSEIETRNEDECDFREDRGCDKGAECRPVDGRGRCFCRQSFAGNYPDCKLRCVNNRDCFNAHECWRNRCVDPCDRSSCGIRASCRVLDHQANCECDPGFEGNPWIECSSTDTLGRRPPPRSRSRGPGLPFSCDGSKCTFF